MPTACSRPVSAYLPRRQRILRKHWLACLGIFALLLYHASAVIADAATQPGVRAMDSTSPVELGTRPAQLAAQVEDKTLREQLAACTAGPFRRSEFSIAHRGAPLEYPEHTRESYIAAARQGAGIIECDVTFTADGTLVCRHAQCDLHSTTDILTTPLASRCSQAFRPAQLGADGQVLRPAGARCCTSDITLAEFRTLRGRHDRVNTAALTVERYLAQAPARALSHGTLMTHNESIELFRSLGLKMTPELKAPEIPLPFAGFTREGYARALIDAYVRAKVPPEQVFPQSFDLRDVLLWIREYPAFASQTIYLDGRYEEHGFDPDEAASWQPDMAALHASGLRIIAPPLWVLVTLRDNAIAPSAYALAAKQAGLELITWTLERSGPLAAGGGWYYQSIAPAIDNEGDVFELLHVLANEVGVRGVFSDWPATVTFYANCQNLP